MIGISCGFSPLRILTAILPTTWPASEKLNTFPPTAPVPTSTSSTQKTGAFAELVTKGTD